MKIIKPDNSQNIIDVLRLKIRSMNFNMNYYNRPLLRYGDVPDLSVEKTTATIVFDDSMELDTFIKALTSFKDKSVELCGEWRPQRGEK